MKAIGEVQPVGAAHFVSRASLLAFLEDMATASSVEEALRARLNQAAPVPRPANLRLSLPDGLRRPTVASLPSNIHLGAGDLRITGAGAEEVIESLFVLAQVMRSDLDAVRALLDPLPAPGVPAGDDGLRALLASLQIGRAHV